MSDFLDEESIKQYPEVYAKIHDIQQLSKVRDGQYRNLNKAIKRLDDDNFFSTASLAMIERLERMAKIEPKPTQEDLTFRRMRSQNRYNLNAPLTARFFAMKFDEIIGVGKWKAVINKSRTTLTLECNAENQAWYEEIEATISNMIPKTMRFINVPYTSNTIAMQGSIDSGLIAYGYALGSWHLGAEAFGKEEMKNIIGGEQMVLTQEYLDIATKEMLESVAKVIINESTEINDLSVDVDGNTGYIRYLVPQTAADAITQIALVRSDGTIVSNASVYIPLISDVVLKHNFEMKEGTN